MLRIKRVHSPKLRDQVYALRYRAYRREGALDTIASERFEDRYDAQPNHVLWAVTDDDRVVGSIRTTWYDPTQPQWRIPEMDGYAEDVMRHVPTGKRLFSGSRFVTEQEGSHLGTRLPLILLRCHVMTFDLYGCEWALAAVRQNHLPFYQRVLRLSRISEGRVYPGLKTTMLLTACNFRKNIDAVYRHTPELIPRAREADLASDIHRNLWENGLPVECM